MVNGLITDGDRGKSLNWNTQPSSKIFASIPEAGVALSGWHVILIQH